MYKGGKNYEKDSNTGLWHVGNLRADADRMWQ
jgi:hypothetical protein